jgi:hypothetical protein
MSEIELATPVSHLFEDPEAAKRIIAVSDCLEARERNLDKTFANQRLFHIDIDIVHEWDDARRSYLRGAFDRLPELELATLQITANCDAPIIEDMMYKPGGRRYTSAEMREEARKNIGWLREILPDDVKLGVENNNYYPSEAYELVTDADFLSPLIIENDLYLLLDIAHAMVTAHNRGRSFEEYIAGLPLERCIQLHVCRPAVQDNGMAYDAHEAPDEAMIEQTVNLTNRLPVRYVTVEFYKDADILIQSLKSLRGRLS